MKGIIIYKSACGSTEQYAKWISEETGYQAVSLSDVKNVNLDDYDVIIAGSLVLASKIVIAKWLVTNWEKLKNKEVVLFSTSGAKPCKKVKEEFMSNSIPEDIASTIEYFPMHGRRRQEDLSLIAKLMMWIAVHFVAKDDQEKEEMSKDFDGIDRKYIDPLVTYVNALA